MIDTYSLLKYRVNTTDFRPQNTCRYFNQTLINSFEDLKRLKNPFSQSHIATSVTFQEATAPVKLPNTQYLVFSLKFVYQNTSSFPFLVSPPTLLYRFQLNKMRVYSKGAQGLSVQLCQIASSRLIQFHGDNTGDSGAVVTPFVQDGIYPSRDFATLGPSGLRPPFTGVYKKSFELFFFTLQHWAGVRFYTSYLNLAKSYVFIKQSPLLLK
eukprot:TRINITY_DN270_c0_g1_i7.p3 TRINITY_DN270_c0_g1~~TRINITY_DN270_c0_g1_i7.p3  ORF type:complete len:211 (-),score=-32.06 TRINITY_DN270_c0_g1_i7:801-1433(-)